MIVKSLSRKTPSFRQILEYISRSDAKTLDPIFHNLQTSEEDVKKIEREFRNNSHYCRNRANGVIFYHEVLALSGKDREKITGDILNDLAYKYLELRARRALAYGIIHFEHTNPHIHFVISGNLVESPKKLRLSKRQFNRIQKRLEEYQKHHYPELENSIAFEDRGVKVRQTGPEVERTRRLQKQGKDVISRKESVRQVFLSCLTATNQKMFFERLQEQGIEIYTRGKTIGINEVSTGGKHRLNTLGLLERYQEAIDRWNRIPERQAEIADLEESKFRKKWMEFGFKDQILEVLSGGNLDDSNKRQNELRRILQYKRRKSRDRGLEL